MQKNIVIDIETFGTRARAAIIQIGAVALGEPDEYFERKISWRQQGRSVDAETMRWWFDQRAKGTPIPEGVVTLPEALRELAQWMEKFVGEGETELVVWGNGPTFDITILTDAFRQQLDEEPPWQYKNERCMRTIIDAARKAGWRYTRRAPEHDALQDAIDEAGLISGALAWLSMCQPVGEEVAL